MDANLVERLDELGDQAHEGGQSGTSTLSKNLAAQQYSEPDKALTDDMGQQMAQGAIAGLGGAGVTEGPSTIAHVAVAGARGVADAAVSGSTAALAALP